MSDVGATPQIVTMQNAANKAYADTLKKYHGMLVKGVFSVAMSAVPSWEGLVKVCHSKFFSFSSFSFSQAGS